MGKIEEDSIKVVVRLKPDLVTEAEFQGTKENVNPVNHHRGSVCEVINNRTLNLPATDIECSSPSKISTQNNDRLFTFDRVFDTGSTQESVYEFVAGDMLKSFFQGYNGTILAYGQTGSGKSHTMFGPKENRGVIPRICHDIFKQIETPDYEDCIFTVSVSFMEVYLEKIYDLLAQSLEKPADKRVSLSLHDTKDSGIYVKGLNTNYVTSEQELLDYIKQGESQRNVSSTSMNLESSRSHSIVRINLEKRNALEENIQHSFLYLVDLAGSEKVGKTNAAGVTLEEAKKINSSLSALGNVINALTQVESKSKRTSAHIPYRDSKLTRLLQDSLGGNSKTTLILNCSTSRFNEQETLSTLRFGSRAKKIKNFAILNKNNLSSRNSLEQQLEELKSRETGYLLRISTLEKELLEFKAQNDVEDPSQKPLPPTPDLLEENKKLKSQVESLAGLISHSNSGASDDPSISFDDLIQNLMNRCENVVEIQASLDEQVELNKKFQQSLASTTERMYTLEDRSQRLLYQLQETQIENQDLMNTNNSLARDLKTTLEIAGTRSERIKVLESTVKELSMMRMGHASKNSISSSVTAVTPIEEEQEWSPQSGGIWGMFSSRRSSNSSTSSTKKPNVPTSKPKRQGINLNVVKPIKGGTSDKE